MKSILVIMAIGAFLVVSGMDYEDAIEDETRYADNFCKGYHPDYKNLSPNCEEQ
jgi:hypothetical protein